MKKHHSGHDLRNPTMPKEHFTMHEGELNAVCKEKYATEFGNPKDLERSTVDLANYVKKHKMKY